MTTNLNLATEINIVKGAIASSNNKVTSLLNTVHYLQNKFLLTDNSFSEYIINIDSSINHIKEEFERLISNFDGSFVTDISFQNIQSQLENFDSSLNYLYQNLSNSFENIQSQFKNFDVSLNYLYQNLSNSFVTDISFEQLSNNTESNINFLTNQNTLVKNDVTFNYSLIDNNSLLVNELQSKISNLLTLINNNLGTSYTYNDI